MSVELLKPKGIIHTKPNGKREWKGLFLCECGSEFYAFKHHVANGATTSCGCIQKRTTSERFKKHGLTNSKIYKQWFAIKRRCFNHKNKDYIHYGGRGITMCNDWLTFNGYYEWAISSGYSDNLEIDRIDVDGNYEPSNCRFVTRYVNVSNIGLRIDNKTGYTGVTTLPNGKFRVTINVNKKTINLGCFDNLIYSVVIRNEYIDKNNLPHRKG
jgi:hypothetical protein